MVWHIGYSMILTNTRYSSILLEYQISTLNLGYFRVRLAWLDYLEVINMSPSLGLQKLDLQKHYMTLIIDIEIQAYKNLQPRL